MITLEEDYFQGELTDLYDKFRDLKKENKTLRNTLLYIRKEIRNKEMPYHEENDLYNYITDVLNKG